MNRKRTIAICLLTTLVGSCSLLVKNEETFKCVESAGHTLIFRHIKSKGIVKVLTANGMYDGQIMAADELGDNIIWQYKHSEELRTTFKLNRKTMEVVYIGNTGDKGRYCLAEWVNE